MKKLTREEKSSTYRIFNHVNDISENYYGRKTMDETNSFVSLNRWIMFPAYNVASLRDGAGFPAPNLYISCDDVIVADDYGRVNGWIGITYGNTQAMIWLHQLLKDKNVTNFIQLINNLGDKRAVSIEQKIKTGFYDNTPIYKSIEKFNASIVTDIDIKNSIKNSNAKLIRPGEMYDDESVIWCVTVFNIYKETFVSDFDNDVKIGFDFFNKILNLR